ncbi:hypothetical protein [Flavobacterium sp.]|uniref:hypothetical protein n=1 Tax=Flavobacterium sp. TaxID=239 RepID=UPI0039E64F8A
MKKTIYLLLVSFFMINCSSESNDNENSISFSINLTPSATNVDVDQAFTINVSTTEEIKELWVSTDNFATGGYAQRQFGTSYTLNFNFDSLGQKTISVRAKNQNNVVSEKQVVISVLRGNALKINGVQVISFYGINTTYDPEFGLNDSNRLADLKFGFAKNKLVDRFLGTYNWLSWYNSTEIENQGNMTWQLNDANLFIHPNNTLRFTLAEMDGQIAGADLLNGPPEFREISFSSFISTKPSVISYTFPEIDLDIKVLVEWVN